MANVTYKIATNIECSRGNQASICEKDYIKSVILSFYIKQKLLGIKTIWAIKMILRTLNITVIYYYFLFTTTAIIIYCYTIKCCSFEHFIQQRIMKRCIAIK